MKKCLIFLLCIVFMGYMAGTAEAVKEAVKVISCSGDVKITPSGETKAVTCLSGMQIKEGARIITGEEASVDIAFDKTGRNILKIKGNSEVVIKLEGADKIELVDGEIFTVLQGLKRGETFRVKTPCATCGARGTGWNTKTDKEVTDVAVFDGRVFVRGIKKDGSVMDEEYWVEKGFERKIRKFEDPGKMEKISEARLSKIEKEVRRPAEPVEEIQKKRVKPSAAVPSEPGKKRIKGEGREESKEKIRTKREELIERRGQMEMRIEKRDSVREDRTESILERKDDKKIEEIRRELDSSAGTGDR
jgi:hypothetical protein